jgi:deoxyribodipyrimidine photo-lyase
MKTAIWWLRRDLRLADNQALQAALARAERVVPLFILDPALWRSPYAGQKRIAFLLAGLRALEADLRARGSALLVRQGAPSAVLAELSGELGGAEVFAEEDYTPYARRRDRQAASAARLHLLPGLTVHHPSRPVKSDGSPYTVYTPFNRAWKALPLPGPADLWMPPAEIPTLPALIGLPIPGEPVLPDQPMFIPGEAEAQRRLRAFTAGPDAPVYRYGEGRHRPDLQATSSLSPYLRFGMLSARQAVVAALESIQASRLPGVADPAAAQKCAATFLDELIWREFYQAILFHFPFVRRQSFRSDLRQIAWLNDAQDFEAWRQGRTGYPIVDAAMRQLAGTGWMHNRCRMIVASFLTKDLLIDWRWGEQWFMQQLIDGDPAANNGGWQWTAGTGTDAAPYFRIFNPISQGEKFDPHGHYIRRWVPELRSLPDEYIHQPWMMPAELQRKIGCVIGVHYPARIVDHYQAREHVLAAYQKSRAAFQAD